MPTPSPLAWRFPAATTHDGIPLGNGLGFVDVCVADGRTAIERDAVAGEELLISRS